MMSLYEIVTRSHAAVTPRKLLVNILKNSLIFFNTEYIIKKPSVDSFT